MESSPQIDQHDTFEAAQNALDQRRAILGPCLAAMGFTEHGGPPPDLRAQLRFDGQVIELEPWEHSVLLGQAGAYSEILLAHLAEGLAFWARCSSLLQILEVDPPQNTDLRQLGEVIEHTAVGIALQAEVQRDIDRLVGQGAMAEAKKLTGFRRRIDQGLSGLKQSLGQTAHEQAQARSVEMLTPRIVEAVPRKKALSKLALDLPVSAPVLPTETPAPEPAEPQPAEPQLAEPQLAEPQLAEPQLAAEELFELGLLEQEQSVAGAPTRARIRAPREPNPAGRFRRLMFVLVGFAVLYAVFLSVRPRNVPVPDRLDIQRFAHLDGVIQVRPRPPSLFVKLDTNSWAGMSTESKRELLKSLGQIAGDEGYLGVQVKTNDGKTVGQWMKKTGVKLIARPSSS